MIERQTLRALAALAVTALAGATALAGPAATAREPDPLPGEYTVRDGMVDRGTFSGWRIFHTSCHGCHGVGGGGTDMAPNLVQRIKDYTPRGFATKVLTSYRIVATPESNGDDRERLLEDILKRERSERGQVVMPAWESDGQVPPHVLDLYAYLNARADGVIGVGRPAVAGVNKKRLPKVKPVP